MLTPDRVLAEDAPDYPLAVAEAYGAALAPGSTRLTIHAAVVEIAERYEFTVPQTALLAIDVTEMLVNLFREMAPLEMRAAVEDLAVREGTNARLAAAFDEDEL